MNQLLDNQDNRSRTGYLLLALGAFFLISQWLGWSFAGLLWPLFVILPGAAFLYAAIKGDEKATGLIYPGAIIAGTGAILFMQNLTGHWESWAYIWTLYPALVGLAMTFEGKRRERRSHVETGRQMVQWGLAAFGIGFLFFELLIFGNFGGLAVLLLAFGALMLLNKNKSDSDRPMTVNDLVKPKRIDPAAYTGSANGTKRKHDETEII